MDSKIIRLSFGFSFGILREIGSNRVLCYFLVDTFKVEKDRIDFNSQIPRFSKVSQIYSLRAIGLKCWQFRFPFEVFSSFSVQKISERTDGRTDRQIDRHADERTDLFPEKIVVAFCSRIYRHVHTYLDYFSYLHF